MRMLTLAAAPVGGVSVEARDAALAVPAGRQVLALLTHALVDTLAVAVTLTGCQQGPKLAGSLVTAGGDRCVLCSDLGSG